MDQNPMVPWFLHRPSFHHSIVIFSMVLWSMVYGQNPMVPWSIGLWRTPGPLVSGLWTKFHGSLVYWSMENPMVPWSVGLWRTLWFYGFWRASCRALARMERFVSASATPAAFAACSRTSAVSKSPRFRASSPRACWASPVSPALAR